MRTYRVVDWMSTPPILARPTTTLYQSAFPRITLQVGEAQQSAIQDCMLERGLVLAEAQRIMEHRKVRRLPVVQEGRLVGIITWGGPRDRDSPLSGDRRRGAQRGRWVTPQPAVLRLPGASLRAFWHEARRTTREVAVLVEQYRQGRPVPPLQRRSVILVDDGLGNGLVQLAAIAALRRAYAARCVVATPFATTDAIQRVARQADLVLALASEGERDGRGPWCQPVDDADAQALLQSYQQWRKTVADAGRSHDALSAG